MLYLDTLGIQYKNKIYILFNSNTTKQDILRLIKNYEYNINTLLYLNLLKNNKFIKKYIDLFKIINILVFKTFLSLLNIFFLNMLFRKNIFIYIKYNFIYFLEKAKMYTYIDRFYYLAFLNKMLDLNKKYTFKLKLIEIFSYNYIAIFIYIYYFKNKNVNLRYSYIITNRYLFKYLN